MLRKLLARRQPKVVEPKDEKAKFEMACKVFMQNLAGAHNKKCEPSIRFASKGSGPALVSEPRKRDESGKKPSATKG